MILLEIAFIKLQSIMNANNQNKQPENHDLTLKQATKIMREFVRQRNWEKYHTPRNLVMALTGQVGQIAQIFQWKGEVQNGLPQFSDKEKVHVGQQIADVLSYLIRLADVCDIDIEKSLKDKWAKNRKKYPSDKLKQNENLIFEIKQQRRIIRQGVQSEEKIQEQKK